MKNVKNKSFRKFLVVWTGEWISSIGSGLTAFSLAVYVYQMTHTATSVALVTLCAFLPSILLAPVGGVLADRFDRRLLMILGDLGSALGLVYVLIIMLAGPIALWQIYLGVTFSSVFVSLLEPSYKATVTDLLTEEEFAKASGLVQLSGASKYLLSPFIAAFLLGIADIKTVLIIDIATFLITIFAVFFIRTGLKLESIEGKKQHFLKDLSEGWKVIAANKGVVELIAVISVVTFYIGFVQTLITPLLLSISNVTTLGSVQSVSAVGMLVSSMMIGIFNMKKNYTNKLALGLGLAGLFIAMMGLTTNIYVIAASGFLFFAALPLINTSADVLIRTNIPNEQQGRAWGNIGILSQLGFVAAYGVSGLLADTVFNPLMLENGPLASSAGQVFGTGPTRGIGLLFFVSGFFIAVIAIILLQFKSVRALEKPPEKQPVLLEVQ